MKETRDRTIDKPVPPFPGETASVTIREQKPTVPRIERVGFRSFDRQYLIADQRVVDYIRPDLWLISGPRQVYLVTQLREPITSGPAAVFTAYVPDTHHFQGHHGGWVIPLYRDAKRTIPNVVPKLLALLRERLQLEVNDEDLMSYIAGVVAHSGYTERFFNELRQPGVRVPLTAVPDLWCEAVLIGKQIIWLHTFGERFEDDAEGRLPGQPSADRPAVIASIPGRAEDMPESITYDEASRGLALGSGRIGPVSPPVWDFEISGMRVIKHWFDYRKRNPTNRRSASDLDELTADRWTREMTEELRDLVGVLEGCVKLEARQADVLGRIVESHLITTADLEDASVVPPPQEAKRVVNNGADLTLF